ncbi:MAG: putative sulfurtransferase [Acidimicrobiaceae bacterium]|nr:putative sulfurtransferase [Acidimicrobiaceae bacterium]
MAADGERVPEVSAAEAQRLLSSGAQLLDVREADEWAAGHAPQARWIPLGELGERLDELSDAELVVVCRSGGRSLMAAGALVSTGREASNLAGGMQAWQEAGFDVVDGEGSPGTVI